MESIGEFFRQVREMKGLTVEEVASKTRIRTDFVRALEEGNFAKLPDQVFARGFVRSYARSLGLDEEDAIHRFIQSAGTFYEKQEERERLRVREAEEERRRQANRKAVGVAIAIAIVTLVVLLGREQSALVVRRAPVEPAPAAAKKSTPPKEAREAGKVDGGETMVTGPAAKEVEPSRAPTEPVSESKSTEAAPTAKKTEKPGSEATTSVVSSAGAGGPLDGLNLDGGPGAEGPMTLDLEATELSWVVVQVDGGSPQEALLRPGEKTRWTAQDQFTLTLGNAGGVKALLNGKPQKPFGPSGKVARDIVLKR
jgi:cytoskeletal protein RodZ